MDRHHILPVGRKQPEREVERVRPARTNKGEGHQPCSFIDIQGVRQAGRKRVPLLRQASGSTYRSDVRASGLTTSATTSTWIWKEQQAEGLKNRHWDCTGSVRAPRELTVVLPLGSTSWLVYSTHESNRSKSPMLTGCRKETSSISVKTGLCPANR